MFYYLGVRANFSIGAYQGLIMSLPITFWTLILVLLCVFLFAMLCAELVVRPVRTYPQEFPEEYIQLIDQHFFSLEASMLTFVQFITMDNIATIYKPMIKFNLWLKIRSTSNPSLHTSTSGSFSAVQTPIFASK